MYRGRIKFIVLLVLFPLLVAGWGIVPTVKRGAGLRKLSAEAEQFNQTGEKRKQEELLNMGSAPLLSNGQILACLEKTLKENKVEVVGYTPFFTTAVGQWNIYSGELELKGEFIPLLRIIDQLKKTGNCILSVNYRLLRNLSRKEKQLHLTLLLQAIETKK